MKRFADYLSRLMNRFCNSMNFGMRAKLILIVLITKVIPLMLLTGIALAQFVSLGSLVKDIAVQDSTSALGDIAVENIERMTTDTARRVEDFLYGRDDARAPTTQGRAG